MQNLELHFSYPWLLLLLIPAVFFTLFSYFRLNKRYRCTRNRICSIVLHLCVMFFAIFTLAGFMVRYQVPNEKNEIIILVDKSNSENESQDAVDSFVYSVLEEGKYDEFNIGIVTFGFDQKYVLPLTDDLDKAYETYLSACLPENLPDVSATNVAAALTYTKSLFTNPQSGKILLVTDGKETDEDANQVIREISAQGTRVDVAFVPSEYTGNDTQIVGIELPEYHVGVGDECDISVTLESNAGQNLYVALFDNGVPDEYMQKISTQKGMQTVTFKHVFKEDELHEIRFKIYPQDEDYPQNEDRLEQNNEYCTYYYLETFNKILIVEREEGQSDALIEMLNSDSQTEYTIKTACISDEDFPNDITLLRSYDQVILNNISNADIPEGFDEVLSSYVEEFGGGLFTVGGNDEEGNSNAYNRSLNGKLYREILPVELIDYTPPVAVMIILDRSGSMRELDDKGNSYFAGAKAGALACLAALSERDYIGVMTLDEDPEVLLPLTPRTQERKIKDAIGSVENGIENKATFFSNALNNSGAALNVYRDKVAKRHIVIVTDCGVSATDTKYKDVISSLNQTGITVSIIGVGQTANEDMEEAVALGGGVFYPVNSVGNLVGAMQNDLRAPFITDVKEETFNPVIYDITSPLVRNLETGTGIDRNRLTVELGGFYGVKVKAEADLILVGNYNVPIYAQWKYGKGTVGSFMCDLQSSKWSEAFMEDENGQTFIRNVINNLMPTEDIRPKEINVSLIEDNYTNTMSVLTELAPGEKVVGEIVMSTEAGDVIVPLDKVTDLSESDVLPTCYVTTALSAGNNYSRCGFVVKESGVFTIVLRKVNDSGKVLDEKIVYKAFSYSEEYDSCLDETEEMIREKLETLATKGNGKLIEDLEETSSIFDEFVKAIDRTYDPRFLFMILAIVLFLADIAVRKFKFKWLHEVIRDKKKNKF